MHVGLLPPPFLVVGAAVVEAAVDEAAPVPGDEVPSVVGLEPVDADAVTVTTDGAGATAAGLVEPQAPKVEVAMAADRKLKVIFFMAHEDAKNSAGQVAALVTQGRLPSLSIVLGRTSARPNGQRLRPERSVRPFHDLRRG